MFLNLTKRRNQKLITTSQKLHQKGLVPANSYIIDLDIVEQNAKIFKNTADKFGLKTFAMTKQVGRNSSFCKAIMRGGIDRSVSVDMACALANHDAGLRTGHLGHLVQVPKYEAIIAAKYLKPDYWTVFNLEKAKEAAEAASLENIEQSLLIRIRSEGDVFYKGHEGGFLASDVKKIADEISHLSGAKFSGITSFPALLFDNKTNKILSTPNLNTLSRAKENLEASGFKSIEVNTPGTNSSIVLDVLANAGATQCEPGSALHGTTPLHAIEDLPELPAVIYLSEISHLVENKAYCFGGGLYIDPVFPKYDLKAIISNEEDVGTLDTSSVDIPPAEAIDYYGIVDNKSKKAKVGSTVIFGFRGQAFVTRANTVGVSGIQSDKPIVETVENPFGQKVNWSRSFSNQLS